MLTSGLLLFANGCGPDVNDETDWAIGKYSSVGFVGPLVEVSDKFNFSRYMIREGGVGTYEGEECGSVTRTQNFEWVVESDNVIRLIPPGGAEMFDNLPNTSFLLHRATGCAESRGTRVDIYFIERLNNGDLQGGQERPLYRTSPCAIPIAAPSPCPDGIECGPGSCELSWCDDEAPEPCELDD